MRARSVVLVIAGAALLSACGSDLPFEPAGPEEAPTPSALGPYPVGVRTLLLEDTARETTGRPGPRKVVTEVWYPAVEDARLQVGAIYTLRDVLNEDAIRTASITAAVAIQTDAVRDAEARREDGPFPVIFFSHGSNGIRMQSTYLMSHLASHGYVVVAPDHEGNVLSDLIIDHGIPDAGLAADLFFLRPADIQFLMTHMQSLPAGDPLAGLADFGHVGVIGHSFGALTAVRVAGLADPGHPVHAVIAQAPPGYGLSWLGIEKPLTEIGAPLMIQAGELDGTTSVEDGRSFWPQAASPKLELILGTAGHFTFSDLCQLEPALVAQVVATGVGDALDDGCGAENIGAEEAYVVLRHFTVATFNTFLRGSPGSQAFLSADAAAEVSDAALTFRMELAPE